MNLYEKAILNCQALRFVKFCTEEKLKLKKEKIHNKYPKI